MVPAQEEKKPRKRSWGGGHVLPRSPTRVAEWAEEFVVSRKVDLEGRLAG